MPTITIDVDDALVEQMDEHPDVDWGEVTRQAIREKLEMLELMEDLDGDGGGTDGDVDQMAAKIDESAREFVEDELE